MRIIVNNHFKWPLVVRLDQKYLILSAVSVPANNVAVEIEYYSATGHIDSFIPVIFSTNGRNRER